MTVFNGMLFKLLSASFCFLSSTGGSTSGWESFRLYEGGFVVDMLMSLLVSEPPSRSATGFLIIGKGVKSGKRDHRRVFFADLPGGNLYVDLQSPLVFAELVNGHRRVFEVSDDEIWGISFPIRLGSLFLDRQGFSKIN